ARDGIEVPATHMVHEAADLKRLSKSVGGYPLYVKILRGNERHGTMVAETPKSLLAALEAVLGLGHDLVLQQYLKGGRELRVVVERAEGLYEVAGGSPAPQLTAVSEKRLKVASE